MISFRRALLFLLAGMVFGCGPQRSPQPTRPVSTPLVSCQPPGHLPAPGPGRERVCVIDVGSRNVKLMVASVASSAPQEILDQRVCRSRLQLGEKTFDQAARSPRSLPEESQAVLADLLADYAQRCGRDGGRLLGAVATEWARRAPNREEIRRRVAARTGLALEVLTREEEARYGYLAATRGAAGKLVLDFGSRSLQLSYWPKSAPAPRTTSLPLGIDEAGERFFSNPEHQAYGPARAAFAEELRATLAPALAEMRDLLRRGELAPELLSLAENGDVALAVGGQLWDAQTRRGVDEGTYVSLLKSRPPSHDRERGPVTAVLSGSDVLSLRQAVDSDAVLFEELRSGRGKGIYGYKMLAYPALVGLLVEALGLDIVVLVPQEMPVGVAIEKMRHLTPSHAH